MGTIRGLQGVTMAVLLSAAVSAWAQGSVPVTVQLTDPTGAVIPGVTVGIAPWREGSGFHVKTGADGEATIPLLPARYNFFVDAQEGWGPAHQLVSITKAMAVHIVLLPGPMGEPIRVAMPPPPQTTSAPRTTMMAGSEPAQEPNPPAHYSTMPLHPQPQNAAGVATVTAPGVLTILAGPRERGVFTPATLKDYPHVTVTIFNHRTKKKETYSGVPLMDLLAKLGVPHGNTLRGKALGEYIVATGSDGYKSVVALGEVDPTFHPGVVLVADTLDGQPLGAKTGPFRLVVSEDKRPARSVRNLVEIEVKTAE